MARRGLTLRSQARRFVDIAIFCVLFQELERLKKQVCRTVPTHLFFIVALTCWCGHALCLCVAVTRCAAHEESAGEDQSAMPRSFSMAAIFSVASASQRV